MKIVLQIIHYKISTKIYISRTICNQHENWWYKQAPYWSSGSWVNFKYLKMSLLIKKNLHAFQYTVCNALYLVSHTSRNLQVVQKHYMHTHTLVIIALAWHPTPTNVVLGTWYLTDILDSYSVTTVLKRNISFVFDQKE